MFTYIKSFKAIWKDEGAVTALEYAVLAGIVGLGVAAGFATYGTRLLAKVTTALA